MNEIFVCLLHASNGILEINKKCPDFLGITLNVYKVNDTHVQYSPPPHTDTKKTTKLIYVSVSYLRHIGY